MTIYLQVPTSSIKPQIWYFKLAVFSRQPLSRLTFLKVVWLQTSLSDLKMIRVFTGKIKRGESSPMQ